MVRMIALSVLMSALAVWPAHNTRAAQDSATVDSILDKSIAASGGKAALEKVKTRFIKGELDLPAMSLKGPWELSAKAPNKQLSHVEIPGVGATDEGFDGKVAWAKVPGGGVREKTGEEFAKVKRDTDFYRELNVKKLYPDLAYKGSEQFEGESVEILESKPTAGSKERFSFSKKSGLLVRQQSEFESSQGTIQVDLRLLDYRPYEGLQFPRKLSGRVTVAGQEMEFNITVSEIRHNQPMDDSKFAKPEA